MTKVSEKKTNRKVSRPKESEAYDSKRLNATTTAETSGGRGGNAKWIFARAEDRAKSREEEKRSDWLFERASERKKFHELMSADWNTRSEVKYRILMPDRNKGL